MPRVARSFTANDKAGQVAVWAGGRVPADALCGGPALHPGDPHLVIPSLM